MLSFVQTAANSLFASLAQNSLLYILVILSITLYFVATFPEELQIEACLVSSLSVLFCGIYGALFFHQGAGGFQLILFSGLDPIFGYSWILGVDGLSFVFLLLTLLIFPFCFLATRSISNPGSKRFCVYLLAMEILLILTFTTLDLFYFYVFFESLLIPMFVLIGVYGARSRKVKASYYFFLYTMFGSLIMLFSLIYLYIVAGSTNYLVIAEGMLDDTQQQMIWICFFMAFAVKIPLYPFHIWLPEAHVEAPTVGSMLLASLLLKLGGYGFLRFSLTTLGAGSESYGAYISVAALLGVLYGSLSTIRQIDLKRIIAYSSVAHMNFVTIGIFCNNQQGIEGAIYLMVGHGVVSTGLFFCVGVLYDRCHSRLLRYYGGLATVMPLFASFFLFFTLANLAFPGTSNFLGELLVLLGIYSQNTVAMVVASTGMVLSAVYSLWCYNRIAFGTLKTKYIARFSDVNARELLTLVGLFVCMITLGVTANFLLEFLHLPVCGLVK